MLTTGRYKWLTMGGVVIRLIGYGVMIRLRGQQNSMAELFAQQVIQGIGSGIIQTTLLVPSQVAVPHAQISQVLALIFSMSYLGRSIGSAIAEAFIRTRCDRRCGCILAGTGRRSWWMSCITRSLVCCLIGGRRSELQSILR